MVMPQKRSSVRTGADRAHKRSTTTEAPTDLQDLIGPPLLLPGEDASQYSAFAEKIRDYIGPIDVIEEIQLVDYVALEWEIVRLRRAKANLIRSSTHAGLSELLKPFLQWTERTNLAEGWAKRDHAAVKEVRQLLAKAGLDEGAIVAQTMAVKLRELEIMENAIAKAEMRRNSALRDIAFHREAVLMRQSSRVLERTEFRRLEDAQETS